MSILTSTSNLLLQMLIFCLASNHTVQKYISAFTWNEHASHKSCRVSKNCYKWVCINIYYNHSMTSHYRSRPDSNEVDDDDDVVYSLIIRIKWKLQVSEWCHHFRSFVVVDLSKIISNRRILYLKRIPVKPGLIESYLISKHFANIVFQWDTVDVNNAIRKFIKSQS